MHVAVVGAGISGLTCAYRLQQAGHEVEVFERDAEVGGRMATVDRGGFRIDIGTNILLDNYERMKVLANEVGLGDEWFAFCSGAGGVLRDGRLTSFDPMSIRDIARYPGLSPLARLRVLLYLFRTWPTRNRLDFFDLSTGDDELDKVDAWSATVARCGLEVAEYLVDPFVRTFHFHSARRLSMKYFDALASLFLTRGGFVTHGFRGHMRALPRALAERVRVRRGARVDLVRRAPGGVELLQGDRSERFDSVVLAVPSAAAAALLGTPTHAQAKVLHSTRYSATVVCSYRVPLDVAGDFEGIWVPFRESAIICDAANEGCKGSRDSQSCVLTLCLHEEAAHAFAPRTDAEVLQAVESEWTRLFPKYFGQLTALHVHRWRAALPIYAVGHLTRVKRFWQEGQGRDGVWLCGDWLNQPWVEGSIRCGEKVAEAMS
ncbi:MAG: FAD-dependent oxidoreductase [Pseudomonadota bacterium]|nr:FAD-dependent oxidoreductase [Pseudomonadota bacterium]